MRRNTMALVLLVSALGCASSAQVSRPPRGSFHSYASVLTGEEIRATLQPNARTALERLRPDFLYRGRSHQGGPAVYVDGIRYDDVRDLSAISGETIVEIRFLRSSDATIHFGGGHTAGAIVVTTRAFPGLAE